MSNWVSYRRTGMVATITMDDGKVNGLSPSMLREINGALDRAEADKAVVILTGREGVFSAGFDLRILKAGRFDAVTMLRSGFELAERLLSFPFPVVVACNGHALAMGTFLLLSADYRIGVSGPYKFAANEVAIGLTVPRAAIEVCRQRLTPAIFSRAVMLSEVFSPETAIQAGFLDAVVAPEELQSFAATYAEKLSKLDMKAHSKTKLRARKHTLQAVRAGIKADMREIMIMGVQRFLGAKLGKGTARTSAETT
jgi:enoyl-CoA hydratase